MSNAGGVIAGLGVVAAGILGFLLWKKSQGEGARRPAPYGGMGDVDGDGWVSLKDAQLVAEYAVGNVEFTAQQVYRGDVNDDGKVNAIDAYLISQYAQGKIQDWPRG